MVNFENPELVKQGMVICREKHQTHPFGIFYGENPLEYSFPLLLLNVILVIVSTRLVRFLLKPLRQPKIVAEIIGGIIIGPSILGQNKKFREYLFPDFTIHMIKTIGVMGFMYYLFLSAVKMDLAVLTKAKKKQWYISGLGVAVPMLASGIVGLSMRKSLAHAELGNLPSLYGVSSAIAITTFPVLYPVVRELNLLSSEIGRLALLLSVVTDVVGIHGVVIFEAAKQGEGRSMAALWYVISLVVILVFIVVGIRHALVWIVQSTPEGKPVEQIYVVLILLGVSVVGFVTDMCGVAICNGPLWLGLAVPDGPPLGATIVEKSETFVMEFLMPISFAYVGMLTDFSLLSGHWTSLRPLFYMALVGYTAKLLTILLTARFFNMTWRDSLTLALILSVRGQVELILFVHWMDLKMVTEPHLTLMVILTTLVTAIVTPLISLVYDPTKPYMVDKRRNLQHTPPNTEMNIVACIFDEENVSGISKLLEVCNPTVNSPFSVHAIHLIELVGRAAPLFIDHQNEEEDPASITQSPIHNFLRNFQQERSEAIKMHYHTSVSPKRSMYQDICELALMKKASLIILPSHRDQIDNLPGTELVKRGVQAVNLNVLAHAPCSVALLVERGSFINLFQGSMRNSVHHFAVLFMGGPDAREALTCADRMAANPDVWLTVVRFLALNGEGDDEMEKKLDDGLVTWFWVKNEGNNKVIYREVVVKNGEETSASILAMNNDDHYDLWITGRKQGMNPVLVRGLSDWSQNHELGVIGDLVASTDLGRTASVLVVQQQVLRGQNVASRRFLTSFSFCKQ